MKKLYTIENNEKKINKYKKELSNLKKCLIEETNIDKKLDIKDKINYYKKQIKSIKKAKKEYLLSNSPHIFEYFEQKKNI